MTAPRKPARPEAKVWRLYAAMERGDWRTAISIASSFQDLGEHRNRILSAASAYLSPTFYRQLGYDPKQVIAEGRAALIDRFGKPPRRRRAQ